MKDLELTKQDTQMAKGVAALAMVMLHLFCRLDDLPYTPLIWIGGTPLIYYLGLFGEFCVAIFCFCSGYAHYLMADAQGKDYRKRLPGKALRLLCNYWIVVTVFAVIGLFFDQSGQIPGSWMTYIGNMLVVGISYNGAWWFVTTYLILLLLSPALAALTRRCSSIALLVVSMVLYFCAYMLRFNYKMTFDSPVVQWLWNQVILFGTSQITYFFGMLCRKHGVVGTLRRYCLGEDAYADKTFNRRRLINFFLTILLPVAAFLGHCVVHTAFVAPFTAAAVLTSLFLIKLPRWAEQVFLLFGRHSTNIWLVHMFFYAYIFKDFAFRGKYPVFVLILMLAACFASSAVIDRIYRPVLGWLERFRII